MCKNNNDDDKIKQLILSGKGEDEIVNEIVNGKKGQDKYTCPNCKKELEHLDIKQFMKYHQEGKYDIKTDEFNWKDNKDDKSSAIEFRCPECGKEVDYKY